jgi:hypothetical protein
VPRSFSSFLSFVLPVLLAQALELMFPSFDLLAVFFILPLFSHALPFVGRNSGSPVVERLRGFDLPIHRSTGAHRIFKRGGVSGSIGLGDNSDLLYTVPIELGNTTTAVHIDTGSSDLWVISDACNTDACKESSTTRYQSSSLNYSGASVAMFYGDSTTGTNASGPIGIEVATIAGVSMTGQYFAAINTTSNPTVKWAAGIFGLGFPTGSGIQRALVAHKFGDSTRTDQFIASSYTNGPLLPRIAMTGELEMPMFSMSLQRNTIDIGGQGLLTVGKLPNGIDNSSLTWVPVRLYSPEDGGVRPPSFAPNEVYPFRWEIDIEGVFLDGQAVPSSNIPSDGIQSNRTSALIDTGNSLIRGPSDVVKSILSAVSAAYASSSDPSTPATLPCSTPRTLAFQIGGKRFPVDPRDFIGPSKAGDTTTCIADNLVSTDPPSQGALFRWSLGDPFLKSNLVAFHYGNLTHPSVDPPRIGFLSMVPADAGNLLTQAVVDAQKNGGNFESTIQFAPTASAAADPNLTVSPSAASAQAAQLTAVPSATAVDPPEPSGRSAKDRQNNSTISVMSQSYQCFSIVINIAVMFFMY